MGSWVPANKLAGSMMGSWTRNTTRNSRPGTLLSRKQVVQVQIQNHWLRTQFCFMSPMKSRSNSPAMNEDSVKRDQRSSSVPDEYNSEIKRTVVSRSRSRGGSRGRRYRSRSRSPRRSRSPEENRLHVGDINEDCRKRDLEKIFSKYGPLKEIWLASYAPFY